MSVYTEDNLVQKTTAEYLVWTLGWNESVYAMQEVFGAAGTLGRTDEGEVLLVRYLRPALEKLNPGLPAAAYDDAVRILADTSVSATRRRTARRRRLRCASSTSTIRTRIIFSAYANCGCAVRSAVAAVRMSSGL